MTNQQHPITPPPELVRQWMERTEYDKHTWFYESYIAEQAARWGADQELEACLDEIYKGVGLRLIPYGSHRELLCSDLRTARRPKPPSLKEQALEAFEFIGKCHPIGGPDWAAIRRALEQLDD